MLLEPLVRPMSGNPPLPSASPPLCQLPSLTCPCMPSVPRWPTSGASHEGGRRQGPPRGCWERRPLARCPWEQLDPRPREGHSLGAVTLHTRAFPLYSLAPFRSRLSLVGGCSGPAGSRHSGLPRKCVHVLPWPCASPGGTCGNCPQVTSGLSRPPRASATEGPAEGHLGPTSGFPVDEPARPALSPWGHRVSNRLSLGRVQAVLTGVAGGQRALLSEPG